MPANNSIALILPLVVVVVAALVVLVADLFIERKGALSWLAAIGLVVAGAVAVASGPTGAAASPSGGSSTTAWPGTRARASTASAA